MIFRDNWILAVNKPPFLRVIPDHWHEELANLRDYLNRELTKENQNVESQVWTVHRLDADTSGVVLFALTEEAHRTLSIAFEKNKVHKTYLAIVAGAPPTDEGKIDLPVSYGPKGKVRIEKDGKPSVTEYRVIEKFRKYSLLELYPKTGRTHQIRIHLQAIGHPLVVDPLYRGVDRLTISDVKTRANMGNNAEESALISRLTLHASGIVFTHPVTGKSMELEAPLPKDFQGTLKALRKWSSL